jgi:AcrR family transcriptional regulator
MRAVAFTVPDSSHRPPGRPRSDVSRLALLDAAYWQVTERGYAAVTAEAIAKAAGAGKQTLYRWWPSKPLLVLAAFAAKARERVDRPRDAAMRAGDLERFLLADLSSLRVFADALRGLFNEAAGDVDLLAVARVEWFAPRAEALRSVLRRIVPEDSRRDSWIEAIEGAVFRRLMLGEPLDDDFARRLAALV